MVNPASFINPEFPLRKAGANQSSAVILLIGTEKYLKEKAINDLRKSLLDDFSWELDYKILHGEDTSANEILAAVSTIPFFSLKRLVVVKGFEKLSKEDALRVVNYIKNPNQYTCLVIDSDEGEILKFDPSIIRHVKVLKFSKPTDNETSLWISKFVSAKGKSIDEGAIEILRELQGSNLLNLSQELGKLVTYTGDRKKITVSDVENLVGKSVMASAFDIAHAAAQMNTTKAIGIIHELVTYGKRVHEIIGLLAWHFKVLLKIKALSSSGNTEYAMMQELRLPKKNARDFFTQSALYSYEDIASKLEILLEADLGIKRPKYNPSMILEFAVIRLCLRA